jgi:hypothetical protein
MLEPEELEEEDLTDPGDPLADEGEEEADLEEPESEDLEDLSVEQLLERDRVLQKDVEGRSRQAADEEEPEEPSRPAASPAPTRREEFRRRYPRSPGLWG